MKKDYIELSQLHTPMDYVEDIERRIIRRLFDVIYSEVLKDIEVPKNEIQNAKSDDLWYALNKGTVTFNRGKFSGKFNATITKELRKLGAKWDHVTSTFRIPFNDLPREIQSNVLATENRFSVKIAAIDDKLRKVLPEKIVEQISFSDLFDKTLFKADKSFRENVKKVGIQPTLTDWQVKEMSRKWENNLKIGIKKFSGEQIQELRKKVRESVFAGNRYGTLVESIKTNYEVSRSRAEFIAQQEVKLCTQQYHETSCKKCGLNEYVWRCSAGSAAHPVRPAHKKLEGTTHSWDDPPITSEPGQKVRRNNPQQDYRCRCWAAPILRFK